MVVGMQKENNTNQLTLSPQHITIEVQGDNSDKRSSDKAEREEHPKNHQSNIDPFNSDKVIEELQKVADQRKKDNFEAHTPGGEGLSLIKKNNIDSNFFNSMIAGGPSLEEKTPDKNDDIFGFLSQATDPKSKEDPFSAFATPMSTGKNKDEEDIFAMLSGSKKNDESQSE